MKRDIIIGSITALVLSFFVFQNFFKSTNSYRRFEISPLVYKPNIQPIDTTRRVQAKIITQGEPEFKTYTAKYDSPLFEERYTLETYMELPLETEGKTVETDTSYKEVQGEDETPIEEPVFIKYLRFQCNRIRNPEVATVHLGGFRFFQGNTIASSKPIHTWNPHSGEKKEYKGGAWSDSDQHLVIFCFSEPIIVSRYELKSSHEPDDHDPVGWKIDGSMNGTYWIPMDDRSKTETAFPLERGKPVRYNMNL
jgi:hypothetical protein